MALHYTTQGFIFKQEDRLDADRVFSIFTKDFGRVEIYAKAARKITSKLKGSAQLFSFSQVEYIQGKNKKTLTDVMFLEKFKTLKEVPEKLEVAYRVSAILDRFIKGEQKDGQIMELLADFFKKLDSPSLSTANYQLAHYYFFWNFISLLGHKPELFTCAACKKNLNPLQLYFSNKEGGVICEDCALIIKDTKTTTQDAVKILRLIIKKDWKTLLRLKVELNSQKYLEAVSENYYQYLLSSYSSGY